jgi:hypothetical protein
VGLADLKNAPIKDLSVFIWLIFFVHFLNVMFKERIHDILKKISQRQKEIEEAKGKCHKVYSI